MTEFIDPINQNLISSQLTFGQKLNLNSEQSQIKPLHRDQPLIIRTPKLALPDGLTNSNQINFYFDLNQISSILFQQWLQDLETTLLRKLELDQSIEVQTNFTNYQLTAQFNKNILIYQNQTGQFISPAEIPTDAEAEALIYLHSLSLTSKSIVFNWEVLQLRIFPPLSLSEYLLDRNPSLAISQSSAVPQAPSPPPPPVPQSPVVPLPLPASQTSSSMPPPTPPVPNFNLKSEPPTATSRVPSLAEIQAGLKKLKPIS